MNDKLDTLLRLPNIDNYIFLFLLSTSFIGEILINMSLLFGFFYWMAITPVFFLSSIFSEKAKSLRTGVETKHLLKYEICYWGSAFFAVILIFMLWDMDRIGPSESSLVIHIILAHTMFLTGIVLGLRFYLVGVLLFSTAAFSITAQMSLNFSLDLAVVIFIGWIGLKVKNQLGLPIFRRESDFKNTGAEYTGEERRSN